MHLKQYIISNLGIRLVYMELRSLQNKTLYTRFATYYNYFQKKCDKSYQTDTTTVFYLLIRSNKSKIIYQLISEHIWKILLLIIFVNERLNLLQNVHNLSSNLVLGESSLKTNKHRITVLTYCQAPQCVYQSIPLLRSKSQALRNEFEDPIFDSLW